MLIAEDPELDDCRAYYSRELELARVEPELEVLEDLFFHVRQFDLALGSLLEGTVESCAEEVGVETEEVLVQNVRLLVFSDDKGDRVSEQLAKRYQYESEQDELHRLEIPRRPLVGSCDSALGRCMCTLLFWWS